MIPYNLIHPKTGEKTKINLPSAEDITLNQFIESGGISSPESLAKLSGTEADLWNNVAFDDVIGILAKYPLWDELLPPKEIEYNGTQHKVPDNIERLPWGAHIMARNLFSKLGENPIINVYPDIIAIFMCQEINGTFSDVAASDIAESIGEIPAIQGYPLASFFLKRWIELQKNGMKSLKTQTATDQTGTEQSSESKGTAPEKQG